MINTHTHCSLHLQIQLGISVSWHNFVHLDSSTPTKFSRHLILHCPVSTACGWWQQHHPKHTGANAATLAPGVAGPGPDPLGHGGAQPELLFADNLAVGAFMQRVVTNLQLVSRVWLSFVLLMLGHTMTTNLDARNRVTLSL